jgi:exodeoxyribonuclease VII large subunit
VNQYAFSFEPRRNQFTVSELNTRIKVLLDGEFPDVWVSGEISGVKLSAAGHYYFALREKDSSIRCACFKMSARYLKFRPQDGVHVVVRARVDVWEARGEYQLIVEAIEPQGYGALQFAFEQLKEKLAKEGLFEAGRKRALPKLPRRIGLVTSPSGAVIQDMLHILERRFPGLEIRLFPALVQGEGSVEAVRRGIRYFSESGWAQVVIVARGGGSLEDLWTFNEEPVARAIAECNVPVVSAIGHETDFTIADFVADLRAPTPSAAAELVVCTREQLLDQIEGCRRKLEQAMRWKLARARTALGEQGVDRASTLLHRKIARWQQTSDDLDYRMRDRIASKVRSERGSLQELEARLRRTDLRLRFANVRRRLEKADESLLRCIQQRLQGSRSLLEPVSAHLTQLSPTKILERGYSLVQTESGTLVRDPAEVGDGQRLRIRVARGEFEAEAKT